ncbi:uncharacterized protein LOC144339596 [Macaca mulatta]
MKVTAHQMSAHTRAERGRLEPLSTNQGCSQAGWECRLWGDGGQVPEHGRVPGSWLVGPGSWLGEAGPRAVCREQLGGLGGHRVPQASAVISALSSSEEACCWPLRFHSTSTEGTPALGQSLPPGAKVLERDETGRQAVPVCAGAGSLSEHMAEQISGRAFQAELSVQRPWGRSAQTHQGAEGRGLGSSWGWRVGGAPGRGCPGSWRLFQGRDLGRSTFTRPGFPQEPSLWQEACPGKSRTTGQRGKVSSGLRPGQACALWCSQGWDQRPCVLLQPLCGAGGWGLPSQEAPLRPELSGCPQGLSH